MRTRLASSMDRRAGLTRSRTGVALLRLGAPGLYAGSHPDESVPG